jgi:DNA repair exonuclease SbcCD ATPase subunit
MIDALSFGLFGKPHRNIKKSQLVNSINQKDCLVEVDFSVGSVSYKIIRGIKPAKFEIYVDDIFINQSSTTRDYQSYLEQNILKLNHKSFHQIVVLGASSFVPFMQLKSSTRRDVIEDVLDIQIFGTMNQILKQDISQIRDDLKDLDSDITTKNASINMQKKHIREIQVLNESHIYNKYSEIDTIAEKILTLEATNKGLTDGLESSIIETTAKLMEIEEKRKSLHKFEVGIANGIRRVNKDTKFYEDNNDCPICKQEIDSEFKSNQIKSSKIRYAELHEGHVKCVEEIQVHNAQREFVDSQLSIIKGVRQESQLNAGLITSYNTAIRDIERNIVELKGAGSSEMSIKRANEDLSAITEELQSSMVDRVALGEKNNYNSVIYEVLKDTGIKTQIIRQYLPMINQLVNKYLQVMDFYVSFYLDDTFNETIKSRHRDIFSYQSFSEGEKMKIDLAILFTWREVARVKNSMSTNLLILDETFDSSLDTDGIDSLIKILVTMSDCNLFVISHKGEILENKFRHKMQFSKDKNFSKIV